MLRVYDDHQPSARSCISLEESLSVGPAVGLSVVRRGDRVENSPQMRLKLDMADLRIKNM
jgi:DNA-binding XRE family transcriptional regulator